MANLKFWKFSHPVLDNLPPFEPKKVNSLVKCVTEHNELAKEKLLYQLLGYIKTRLGKIIYKDTRLRNDIDGLVSYLIEWLIDLIEKISLGKNDENILAYVSVSLRFYCLRYLRIFLSYGPIEHSYYANITQCNMNIETIPNPEQPIELEEKLQDIVKTDNERAFVYLKAKGYTNKEVASILGLTPTDVTRIRKTLYRRFYDEDK